MKYLLFNRVPYDYGANYDVTMVGSKERGFGAYDDKDAKILIKLHGNLITELSEESFLDLKKKLSLPPVSYRLFGTQQQEADKDPNAVYATKQKGKKSPNPKEAKSEKPAEDLVQVGEVEVEDPLEETDK
jgi:hypothetical protein